MVEDNEDHRLILTSRPRNIGDFEILEAWHGQAALSLVAQEPVDLIFMNLGVVIYSSPV